LPTPVETLLHQFYDQLMESQYWPADRMREYQYEQLTHLLGHARANSPFYATRLDAVFRADGSIDFSRWREIPIVKRQDLVEHRQAMLASNVPPHHGQAQDYSTSGSTGVPLTVRANGIASLAGRAAEFRAFDWHGIDFSQVLCRIVDDPAVARWPQGRHGGPWGPPWAYGTSAGRRAEISMFDSYEHMLDFIERAEAQYMITGSTTAHALALEAERLHLNTRLGKLFTTGSTPPGPEREALARVFGASLLQRYASKEANAMGHSCPTGDHFHVHAENVLVEVLRDDGEPCQPGETGTVVVTPFLSTHQPMIRYEQGDLATVGGPCSCGRTLPVLESIAGRLSHVFRFPDGTSTYRRLPESLRAELGARVWQIAQVEPLRIELRYEPRDPAVRGDEDAVIAFMRSLYPADVELAVRRVDKVPLTPAGKLIEYVYEVES
jgi:phenylacetate-CoA ligase